MDHTSLSALLNKEGRSRLGDLDFRQNKIWFPDPLQKIKNILDFKNCPFMHDKIIDTKPARHNVLLKITVIITEKESYSLPKKLTMGIIRTN